MSTRELSNKLNRLLKRELILSILTSILFALIGIIVIVYVHTISPNGQYEHHVFTDTLFILGIFTIIMAILKFINKLFILGDIKILVELIDNSDIYQNDEMLANVKSNLLVKIITMLPGWLKKDITLRKELYEK